MSDAAIRLRATDDTGGAFAAVKARFSTLGGEAAAISAKFAGVSAAISGLLGGVTLGAYFKQIAEGLDALNDLKDATGASIGNLSALEDVAARTGTSFDTVSTALVKFNGALTGAKAGTEAAEVFSKLGLEVANLKELDPAEAFRQTAVALSRFADDGNKARAVQVLFGRSLREVAPLLADLAKSGELNAKVTAEQAAEAEKFNNALASLAKNATDTGRSIVGELLPGLNKALAALLTLRSIKDLGAGQLFIEIGKGNTFLDAADGVEFYSNELKDLQKQYAITAQTTQGLARRGALIDLSKDIESVTKLEAYYRRLNALTAPDLGQSDSRELVRRGRGQGAQTIGDIGKPDKLKAQVDEFEKYLQKLREGLLATQEVSAEEQTRIDINRGLLGVLTEAQKQQALTLAGSLDSIRAQQASAKAYAALQEEGRKLTESLRTEQEKQNDALDRATVLVNAGAISWETYGRAVTGPLVKAQEEIDKLFAAIPKIGKPLEEINTFARQAADNIQDALGESILATLEGNTQRISDIWKTLLKRMVAQALAANVGKYLLGDSYAKTGEIGGAVGGLFDFFKSFGGARATGGPVQAGRPYLVGERGPEIVVPRNAGTVLPNGVVPAAGGGITVNVNVQGDVGENNIKAINAAVAQLEARLLSRSR